MEVLIKNKTYSGGYETKCRERVLWERWEEVPVLRKGTYVVWEGHFAGRKETSCLDGVLIQIRAYVGLRDFFFLTIESHTSTAVAPSANRMGC